MTQNQIAFRNAKETERHNKATEAELNRHQLVQEALNKWSNALTNYQIAVNNAHYTRMDAETERANRAREQQNLIGLAETSRSNQASELIRTIANRIEGAKASETSRHQHAMETETRRYDDALIRKAESESAYTDERTKGEAYKTIYMLPAQTYATTQQGMLSAAQADVQSSVQFRNTMEGIAAGVNSISNLGRTVTSFISPTAATGNAVRDSFSEIFSQLK